MLTAHAKIYTVEEQLCAPRRRLEQQKIYSGAMMQLFLLDLGSLDVDRQVIMPASPTGVRIRLPVPAYLIRTDTGEMVLVDTGMSRAVLSGALDLGERMRPLDTTNAYITDRLATIGLRPADITYVVATHFHFDHAGGLNDFTHARIVVQRAALEAARSGGSFERAIVENPALQWHAVEGDTDLLPGVLLLETSGHTLGHQSVLVTTAKDGQFLLAIDAIYNRDQLAADDWGAYINPEAARASARKVQILAQQTGATLVYGHDLEQWRSLLRAPDYYQ